MSALNCKALFLISCLKPKRTLPLPLPGVSLRHHSPPPLTLNRRCCYSSLQTAPSLQQEEEEEESSKDTTVKQLLANPEGVSRLMKMERKPLPEPQARWFPYLDRFSCGNGSAAVSSGEIIDVVGPVISEERKARFRSVVRNRSYSVCLVVEGLCDFGNVSATFRSADALGIQSVHVVSCDANKRC